MANSELPLEFDVSRHGLNGHGLAFGEASLMSSPPNFKPAPFDKLRAGSERSRTGQMFADIRQNQFAEPGFGGWADERIEIRLRRTKRLRNVDAENQEWHPWILRIG
jgi:hypothetical protein